uniref:Flavin-containing monooxygenase n=1 Tax=Fopius arisanus TaxID=64838 RepID=A0A0C9QK99_9HYME
MRVLVIGAGSAGLAALRHCVKDLKKSAESATIGTRKISEVVCYERCDKIGGTWVYTEKIGVDKYGLPIHSSMYDSLRTNLPKEVMGYPDFQYDVKTTKSYLTRTEILDFLERYCDHFDIRQYIQFVHNVELIEPSLEEENQKQWKVTVRNLKEGLTKVEYFDAIMVCNGHYFQPYVPTIEGNEKFKGKKLHSHDYRVPDAFENKTVVVVGAGPSGMDLALEISKKARNVILSHHNKDPIRTIFPENVIQLPDIKKMLENEVEFVDNTRREVDVILYCTGYKYNFSFLSRQCGVRVEDNMVTPLWKHLLSVENPTLALIGLPFYVCAFSMFDLQVRFVVEYWTGKKNIAIKRADGC